MIDTNKLLDGLKKIYNEPCDVDTLYSNILWEIAKGNWDANLLNEKPCHKCKYFGGESPLNACYSCKEQSMWIENK